MRRLLPFLFLLLAAPAFAQTPVKNPRGLGFQSADHARVDRYEIDIVPAAGGAVVQTITVQKADTAQDSTTQEITLTLNVQPIAFGQYRFVARAVAGTVASDNSDPSAVWERAPGKPTQLRIAIGRIELVEIGPGVE